MLNDTDDLPILDLMINDRNDMINVYLTDGTRLSDCVKNYGRWDLLNL